MPYPRTSPASCKRWARVNLGVVDKMLYVEAPETLLSDVPWHVSTSPAR